MSGQSSGGLMASGFPGSPGSPTYSLDRNNPNQLNMTGWSKPFGGRAMASSFQSMPFSSPAVNMAGGMPFQYKSGLPPPPTGNLPPPPGIPPAPTPTPPGGPSFPGAPSSPGAPTPPAPTNPLDSYFGRPAGPRPFNPGGPNGWTNSGQPVPQMPAMQQGQYGWGWQANGPAVPSMGAKEKLYINHMLSGNPSWANQVDNNNLLGSIGQLSGVQFDPNSPLWQV